MCSIFPNQQKVLADVIDQFCRRKQDFSAEQVLQHCLQLSELKNMDLERISTELSKAYSGLRPYGEIFPIGYVVQRVKMEPKVVGHNAPDGVEPDAPIYRRVPIPEGCEQCDGCPDCYTNKKPPTIAFKIYHWSDYARRKNDELVEEYSRSTSSKIDEVAVKVYGLDGETTADDVIARVSSNIVDLPKDSRSMCKNCNKRPVCYDGAIFCGAACTVMHESKGRVD
jgi:hypothetical protein